MKKFILGFITGGVICATLTGFAVEYAVTVNPFPVKVNGVETSIEGYNINDNTYFKLRDIGDKMGFNVDFADNTIIINSTTSTPEPEPTPIPTARPGLSPLPELPTETRQGVEYVSKYDIEDMLENIGLADYKFAVDIFYNVNDLLNPLLEDIPLYEDDIELMPLDYYNSTLVPLINSLR